MIDHTMPGVTVITQISLLHDAANLNNSGYVVVADQPVPS